MQQIYLPKAVCRGVRVDVHAPPEAVERHRRIRLYERLRAGGCSEALALEAVGTPRSTLFRWRRSFQRLGLAGLSDRSRRPARVRRPRWTRRDEAAVWDMRRRFPFMGRAKIRVMLAREGRVLSEATVGRILAKGVRLKRIRPCASCRGRVAAKRRRRFDGHARRWRAGMKAQAPGELVQVDHMTLNFPGTRIKEFRAVCPFTKMMVSRAHARATALNAKRFLAEMLKDLPFPVRSVQVDGGSEFRRDFEEACREADIPLFVLPPKSPERNGCVEKANDSSRTEFWGLHTGGLTLDELRPRLAGHQHFHNHVRPHQSLSMQTPMEYFQSLPKEGQTQSHMY